MNKIKKSDLTNKQQNFIYYLVAQNKNPTEACRMAGYSYPKETAYKLTRNPAVINLIRQERQRLYATDLATIAVNTLKEIMQDVDTPASARVSASRTALELAGDIGKNAIDHDSNKDLSELTPEQLTRLIDNWEEQRSKMAKPIN